MSADDALPRSAAFRWDRGGWFGAQLGATLWMFLGGVFLLAVDTTAGIVTLAVGAALNLLGVALWRRRQRVKPYPAFQLFIAATGVASLGLFVLWRSLGPAAIQRAFSGYTGYVSYAWLLIFPALMLLFHLQERRARAT